MPVDPAERPTFATDRRVGADDLTAIVDLADDRQRRHLLSGRGPGVAAGLDVVWMSESERYEIVPGVAWDGFGRMILVPERHPISPSLFVGFENPPDEPIEVPVLLWHERAAAGDRVVDSYRVDLTVDAYDVVPSAVDVGGTAVVGRGAEFLVDFPLPMQRFPADGEPARWPVCIGSVFCDAGKPVAPTSTREYGPQRSAVIAHRITGPRGAVSIGGRSGAVPAPEDAVVLRGRTRVEVEGSTSAGDFALVVADGGQELGGARLGTSGNQRIVSFVSGGSDFAEAFPVEAQGPVPTPGDVVAVVDGSARLDTAAASCVSVVTDRAAFVGNCGTGGDRRVPVAMMGIVPVRVDSDAGVGDLLAPSGRHDGVAVVVDRSAASVVAMRSVFAEVVGPGDRAGTVMARVGGDVRAGALGWALDAMEQRLTALADRLDQVDAWP